MPESTVNQVKNYLEELRKKIKDLNVEVPSWDVAVKGSPEGTKVNICIEVLIKKKK